MIVTGMSQHGKDTFCEYLYEKYNITFASSSYTACELFLYEKLKDEFGYKSIDECFEDRQNHQTRWYEEIKAFNTPNKDRLGKIIFNKANAYCGIRDDEEFAELIKNTDVDLIVWIDASLRVPPQSKSSMKLSSEIADHILKNNGTEAEFQESIDAFYHDTIKPIIERNAKRSNNTSFYSAPDFQ